MPSEDLLQRAFCCLLPLADEACLVPAMAFRDYWKAFSLRPLPPRARSFMYSGTGLPRYLST